MHEPEVDRSQALHLAGPSTATHLLRAAISGLVGVGAVACTDSAPAAESDPEPSIAAPDRAKDEGVAGSKSAAGDSKTTGAQSEPEKELETVDAQYTFAELSKMCDARKGYIQTHGSCSGVNTCRGFAYGDWDEEAKLVEHTCSGVNGCAGLSCVETAQEPEGGGLTGKEIMELDEDWYTERAGLYGPKPCKNCHVPSEHNEDTGDYDYDHTKIRLLMWPDAKRDATNWTKRTAKYQEAMIAFGVQGIQEDGTAYSNMAAYKNLFSKVEIERVVKYMREFAPENVVIKELKLKPGKAE